MAHVLLKFEKVTFPWQGDGKTLDVYTNTVFEYI